MRCQKCGTSKSEINSEYCWRIWRLCGKCAKEKHPFFYQRPESENKLRDKRYYMMRKRKSYLEKIREVNDKIYELNKLIAEMDNSRQKQIIEIEEMSIKMELEQIALKKMKHNGT